MFAAPLLLCSVSSNLGEPLTARDLAPFARLDASVRALPVEAARTLASVAKGLGALAPTSRERARAAYDWTVEHVAYSLDRRDAAGALRDLRGDCDAHAAVYAGLCKALGVECAVVVGRVRFAVPPEAALAADSKPLAQGQWLVAHAWNAVRIDGAWGFVDTTMGGKSGKAGAAEDDYFLPDPSVLATDRVADDAQWAPADAPKDLASTPLVRPLAWRLGVGRKELELRDGVATIPWRKGMRASLQTEAGSLPDRALVQPAAGGTEIRLCPTGAASVVWLGVTVEGSWRPLAGYPVVGSATRALPRVMNDFYDTGAALAGPFVRDLAAGKPTEIRLRAPGASKVVAFQGPDVAGEFAHEGDDWVLKATPAEGAAFEVMASYNDPRRFQALLTYDVK